jgi:glutamyl-tRNA reductase
MSIFVVGMNHKTAPLSLREKAYFAPEKWSLYLQDILHRGIAREALLLSTCNRSELYCEAEVLERVREWFCAQTVLTTEERSSLLYVYHDEEAVAHMMAVACGLDSMVLGEAQILGQLKEAFSEACLAGTIDTLFHRLFQLVFTLEK